MSDTILKFPNSKKFALTIFDDTDNGTVGNLEPVYQVLDDFGVKTTKSVWVYPPRGTFSGQCLMDNEYATFVRGLQSRGFEIGLHNVGDGSFTRSEIVDGLEIYKNILGSYPRIHTNHVSNPDNLYGGSKRFVFPLNWLYGLLSKIYRGVIPHSSGEKPSSPHYWGDIAKRHLTYQRNLTFNSINTLRCDPKMPYPVKNKLDCANLWFSSSDGHTIKEFLHLLRDENLDYLEETGGVCIIYTHFASGFVDENGKVNPAFQERIESLVSRDGWFVPVGTLLDHLRKHNGKDADPGYAYRLSLDVKWLTDRLVKRIRFKH